MPWYTLHPFLDSNNNDSKTTTNNMNEIRSKLGVTFQIKGIPTLIVLDRTTGLFITNDARTHIMSHPTSSNKSYSSVIEKWKSIEPVTIEEGIRKANQIYDGTIYSIIKFIINWLLQNPLYILGLFYVVKLFWKSKSASITGNNNIPVDDSSTNNQLLEPVPEDEF
jgi:hypothetical protein